MSSEFWIGFILTVFAPELTGNKQVLGMRANHFSSEASCILYYDNLPGWEIEDTIINFYISDRPIMVINTPIGKVYAACWDIAREDLK